jgi:hypothetical protein
MDSNQKAELIITALQQRIGELTVNYEMQIASLRAEFTILVQSQQDKEEAVKQYEQELAQKIISNN